MQHFKVGLLSDQDPVTSRFEKEKDLKKDPKEQKQGNEQKKADVKPKPEVVLKKLLESMEQLNNLLQGMRRGIFDVPRSMFGNKTTLDSMTAEDIKKIFAEEGSYVGFTKNFEIFYQDRKNYSADAITSITQKVGALKKNMDAVMGWFESSVYLSKEKHKASLTGLQAVIVNKNDLMIALGKAKTAPLPAQPGKK